MQSERVLRHFIKEILRSRMLAKSFLLREENSGKKVKRRVTRIGDEEFQLSDLDIDLIKDYIATELKVGSFAAEAAFNDFISSLGDVGPLVREKVDEFSPQAKSIVLRELINAGDEISPSDFFSEPAPTLDKGKVATVIVPPGFKPLAEYKTPDASSASQHGKGELVVPLLFNNAMMMRGQNPPYDVMIDEKPWHVKSYASMKQAIRMGGAEDRTLVYTEIYDDLIAAGFKSAEFQSLNEKSYIQSLKFYFQKLNTKFPGKYSSIKGVIDAFNKQAIEASMGKAEGICFYTGGTFSFYGPENFVFVGTVGGARIQLKLKSSSENILSRAEASEVEEPNRIVKRPRGEEEEDENAVARGDSKSTSKKGQKKKKKKEEEPLPAPLFKQSKPPDGSQGWERGMKVSHPSFGPGTVKGVEGQGSSEKVSVSFDDGKERKFLATTLTAPK